MAPGPVQRRPLQHQLPPAAREGHGHAEALRGPHPPDPDSETPIYIFFGVVWYAARQYIKNDLPTMSHCDVWRRTTASFLKVHLHNPTDCVVYQFHAIWHNFT
jgi:hypothetical protein